MDVKVKGSGQDIYSVLCMIAGALPLAAIIAMSILTKDFVLFRDYLSDLGVGSYGFVFNLSLIAAGLLLIPFILHLYKSRPYKHLVALFLAAIIALFGVGMFPSSSWVHGYASGAFFLLAFATIFFAGVSMKRGKAISIAVSLLGFAGLAVFSPFVETVQVFAIGLWVIGVGFFSLRNRDVLEK